MVADPSATQATGDLVGMLLSGRGGTLGGAAGTLLLIRNLGIRGERNGGDRLRALEGKIDEMIREQQETNKLFSKLSGQPVARHFAIISA